MNCTGEFALSIDPADADAQTILFQYPSCWAELPMSYIGHSVKLELGARSDSWPSEHIAIRLYVAEQIPNAFQSGECGVNVLTKERTFWEKVALLHEENFRATDKPIKPRMSRHYSDLARMIDLGSADVALNETGLLDRVVAHRRVFFRHSWVDYDLMKRGTFQVVPRSSRVAEWEADYKQMEEMFFEKPPDFKNVLETIRQFETKLNSV
jgi:hypothetical protein